MPNRFEIESRPNFVEPAAFVFAMLNTIDQIKQFVKSNESEIVLALGVILISLISFAAGRLLAPSPVKQAIYVEQLQASAFQNIIEEDSMQVSSTNSSNPMRTRKEGKFVASKNSNKFHLPTCIGARRIAEHNKIWFNSKEEAESLGYEPASNCPGL